MDDFLRVMDPNQNGAKEAFTKAFDPYGVTRGWSVPESSYQRGFEEKRVRRT